jgi:hypothetical protein
MLLFDIVLLGVCLVYGWIIAHIFGGDNFNNVWLWSTFIIFFINDSYVKIINKKE